MLLRVQILYLVLKGENEIRQPVDIVLGLPDHLLLQLLIILQHFIVFLLDGSFQFIHYRLKEARQVIPFLLFFVHPLLSFPLSLH